MLTEHTANSLQLATHGPVERVVREAGHDLVIDPAKALCESLVMMVDDEETTIEVLEAVLEDFGYRNFVTTTRSSEAIDLLMREPVDVVLLDINMPEVTGFDILRDMRSRPELEHVPVIILTASNDSKTKLEALHLGATDFLAKPVDPSELALRLRNTLAAKSYLDRLTYFDRFMMDGSYAFFQIREVFVYLSRDLRPYHLNGFSKEDIRDIKAAYNSAFSSNLPWKEVLTELQQMSPEMMLIAVTHSDEVAARMQRRMAVDQGRLRE